MRGRINGINYRLIEGEGTPLVFIHGWLGSIHTWKEVMNNLELDNPVLLYDQRCHGDSSCDKFSIADLGKDLDSLLQELNLGDPIIIGHSLGGMTALSYASREGNPSGLILLATSASTPEPRNKSFDFYIEKLGEIRREKWAEEIAENYAGRIENDSLKHQSKQELVDADEEKLRYGLEAMKKYNITEELGEIRSPVLVVAGEKDGAIKVSEARGLAESLGADLEVINSGHLIPWEKPEKIAELVSKSVKAEVK